MFKTKLISLLCLLAFCCGSAKAQNYYPQVGDKVYADDGVYVVKGENLISNHSFDNGFDGWTAGDGTALSDANFTILPDEGPDGSACLKSLSSAGSGNAASIKTGWELTQGKTYVFSCWAKRNGTGNAQYSRLYLSDTQNGTNQQIATLTYVSNEWVQTQVVFKADKQFLVANFGWLGGPTWLDCFYLSEVEASDELNTTIIEATIQEADELMATTVEGTDKGQYLPEVRKALQDAIDTAKGILASATAQQEINDANDVLKAAMSIYTQNINPPFIIGEKYTFTNVAASLPLSTGGGTVKLSEVTEANDMVFTFEPTAADAPAMGYHIKDLDGNYIFRVGSWETKSSSTPDFTDVNTIFQIEDHGQFVQIRNMGSGSVLGPDNLTAGSEVYSNKNGMNEKFCWVLRKYVPVSERDDKYYYEMALEEIQFVYDAIDPAICGTRAFMISIDAYTAFGQAIETSKTMSDYVAAKALIEEALATFEANKIVPATEGTEYRIIHSSKLTLHQAAESTQPTLAVTDETTRQSFTFEKTDVPNYYYIKNVTTGNYLAKDALSAWTTLYVEAPETDEAKWTIRMLNDTAYSITNLAGKGCLGTDGTEDGALVYADKWDSMVNAQWNVSDGSDEVQLDRTAFNEAMTKAQEYYESMVEGYHVGEYYGTDIEAFATVMTQAETDAKKAKEQEELDGVATQLLADIETYKGKAHTESVANEFLQNLINECQTEHDNAIVGFEQGNYTEEAKAAFLNAINAAKEATDYEAGINDLTAARETFRASAQTIDRTAFKAAIATAKEKAEAAVAGNCDGQYPAEAIETLKTAVATAETAYNNATATQEEIDAALQALQTAVQDFDLTMVTIDFTALNDAIADAKKALTDAEPEKGEGPGKYPAEGFETLQGAIDAAQAMVGSKEVDQETVNTKTEELTNATITFQNSRVNNDYTELEALIAEGETLYAEVIKHSWISKEDKEQLAGSIERGKAALNSTDQDEIDKTCKILKRDIRLLTMITGIDSISEDGIAQSVENGVISLQDIPAGTQVAVFSVNGTCIAASAGASSFQTTLPQGQYIVTISDGQAKTSIRIMVD